MSARSTVRRGVLVHLALLIVMVAVPGVCLTAAVCTRGVTLAVPTAIALSLGGGYLLGGGVALVLALVGVLSAGSVSVGLIAVSAVALVLAGRARARASWWALVTGALRADRWPLALGGTALLVVAVSTSRFDPAINLANSGRWRYWADAREIAVLGHVPTVTTQWGSERPATVSKLFLNTFSAAYSLIAGGEVLPSYRALYVFGAVATAAALWALAWELGLRYSAPLLMLICSTRVHVFGFRLDVGARFVYHLGLYRAEMIGRAAAFTAVALAMCALGRPGRLLPVIAGFLLGASAISHGVAALAAVLLGLSLAAAWAISQRNPRAAVRTAALVAGPAIAFPAAALLASGGTLGIGGATAHYVAVNGHDPTALFFGSRMPLHTATFYVSPTRLARILIAAATGQFQPAALTIPIAVGAVIVVAASVRWLPYGLAWIVAGAACFVVLLYAVALVFSARSHAYIPATFGWRRMFDYAGPALVLAALPWLEWLIRALSRPTRARWVVGVLTSAGIAAVIMWDMRPPHVGPNAAKLRDAMRVVHDRVPCDGRVLANRKTNGAFEVLAGRENVLDGMAPYLRPELLTEVLHEAKEARAVFRAAPNSRRFLAREHVGYLVQLRGAGGPPAPLTRAPWLTRLYADRNIIVYRVDGAAAGDAPPGLDCHATPG